MPKIDLNNDTNSCKADPKLQDLDYELNTDGVCTASCESTSATPEPVAAPSAQPDHWDVDVESDAVSLAPTPENLDIELSIGSETTEYVPVAQGPEKSLADSLAGALNGIRNNPIVSSVIAALTPAGKAIADTVVRSGEAIAKVCKEVYSPVEIAIAAATGQSVVPKPAEAMQAGAETMIAVVAEELAGGALATPVAVEAAVECLQADTEPGVSPAAPELSCTLYFSTMSDGVNDQAEHDGAKRSVAENDNPSTVNRQLSTDPISIGAQLYATQNHLGEGGVGNSTTSHENFTTIYSRSFQSTVNRQPSTDRSDVLRSIQLAEEIQTDQKKADEIQDLNKRTNKKTEGEEGDNKKDPNKNIKKNKKGKGSFSRTGRMCKLDLGGSSEVIITPAEAAVISADKGGPGGAFSEKQFVVNNEARDSRTDHNDIEMVVSKDGGSEGEQGRQEEQNQQEDLEHQAEPAV